MRRHLEPPLWLLIVGLINIGPTLATTFENKTTHGGSNRPRVFSPRMDYDEWTPLGRGNPLRNDPTYDYVPPVLDRVQYWLDTQTTEPSSKREILLLGATAKKTSPKIPEQYLKFSNRPKFTNNQETQPSYKNNLTNNPGSDPIKLRTTNFRNDVVDYRNQNRIQSGNYYSGSYYGQQSKPYTMMLPPPIAQNPIGDHPHLNYEHSPKDQVYEDPYQFSTQTESGPLLQSDQQLYDYSSKTYSQSHLQQQYPRLPHPQVTSKPTPKGTLVSQIETLKTYSQPSVHQRHESTTSTVTFEKSDLVYQSSQTLSSGWLINEHRPTAQTNPNREHYYQDDHQAAGSSNHEVVVGQNANIIVQGESCGNDEVVIGQKEEAPSVPESDGVRLTIPGSVESKDHPKEIGELGSSSNMHIVLANTPTAETTDAAVALVMPTNYVPKNNEDPQRLKEDTQNGTEKAVVFKTEKPIESDKTSAPNTSVYLENPSTPQPIRNPMPFYQPQTRFPPPRGFGSPPNHMIHPSGPQGRPLQGMMHYGPNLHMGMGLRPPAPPAMSNGPVKMADLHLRQQPNNMMTVNEHNQQRWPYQHLAQSSGATITSPRPSQIMTSLGMNVHGHSSSQTDQTVLKPVQTTFGPISTVPSGSDAEEMMKNKEKEQSQLATLLKDEDSRTSTTSETTLTTTSPIPTTTVTSLTTDQIFSHYKQPAKPLRGPMYLIIQGHSKVKTYKPTVENHGNAIEENEIFDSTTPRLVSKFEKFVNENTKRVAEEKISVVKEVEEKENNEEHPSGQDSLLSLLESGFSAFAMPPLSDLEEENSNSTLK